MSGDQLIPQLLSIRPDIRIILCTGYNEQLGPKTAKDLEINKILMKPVSLKAIAETVRGVLDGAQV